MGLDELAVKDTTSLGHYSLISTFSLHTIHMTNMKGWSVINSKRNDTVIAIQNQRMNMTVDTWVYLVSNSI